MKRWEMLEEWILDNDVETFTSQSLAGSLGISGAAASGMIQSHLRAQRSPKIAEHNLLYLLKRDRRTSNAVWSVGIWVADMRAIGNTYYEDVKTKWLRAVEPDLKRLAEKNPRAARRVQTTLDIVFDGALKIMAATLSTEAEEE